MSEIKVWPRVPSADAIIDELFHGDFTSMVWNRENFERFVKLGRKIAKDKTTDEMVKLIKSCSGLRDMVRDIADTMWWSLRQTTDYSLAVRIATERIYDLAQEMILNPAEVVI